MTFCVECKKKLIHDTSPKDKPTRAQVINWWKLGYSCRDIEIKCGKKISFATASRIIREYKTLKGEQEEK